MTMNERLAAAGVRTIRTGERDRHDREIIYLEYRGRQVRRPHVGNCVYVCRAKLGVPI